jgi:erythronate-4-phosphate dehydrogenase
MTLKIVADENMTAVAQIFGEFGELETVPGRELSRRQVRGADVLLVRSVTRVNRDLLDDTAVSFVGSATIGTDHIDMDYLHSRGIAFAHAPGCNAEAVVDYVLASLFALHDTPWFDKTVAIVGCGNVGGRLYRRLRRLGVRCLCVDPFLSPQQQADLCPLEEVVNADIVCLHTPLTTIGRHPTFHLFNEQRLRSLKPGALLLNAGRGGVVDNGALLELIQSGHLRCVLDVWENEPAIAPELLRSVLIGTPHIAGYSLEGRLRGTLMVQQAFCRSRSVDSGNASLESLMAALGYQPQCLEFNVLSAVDDYGRLRELVARAYSPGEDHKALLQLAADTDNLASGFDLLRKYYHFRREFGFLSVAGCGSTALAEKLTDLGFQVDTK